MTNYLFMLALGEWKQIKFLFLPMYFREVLFIIRKEMFLRSGENCKKLFCMQWQKTFNCIFCLKQQQFWWHDFENISYHILFYVMLIYFLLNMFSKKKYGEKKAIDQSVWIALHCIQRHDCSSCWNLKRSWGRIIEWLRLRETLKII